MNAISKRTLALLGALALGGALAACDVGPGDDEGFEHMGGFEQPEQPEQHTDQPFGDPQGNSYSDQ